MMFYRCPTILTIEEAVKYIRHMSLEKIDPDFQYLYWKMVDSSVEYFTKSVNSDPEFEEEVDIQLVVYL